MLWWVLDTACVYGLWDKRDVDCVFLCCLIVVVCLLPLTLSNLTVKSTLLFDDCCSLASVVLGSLSGEFLL
jgi:hypothetical protein